MAKAKKAKKKAKDMTAAEKLAEFESTASLRMGRVLKGVASLGKLSGARYASTPKHIEAMRQALKEGLESAFSRLAGNAAKNDGFTFPK